MTLKNVKISDAMLVLATMLSRNIYYTDVIITEATSIYFKPSQLPTDDEIKGDSIIRDINFDDEDE